MASEIPSEIIERAKTALHQMTEHPEEVFIVGPELWTDGFRCGDYEFLFRGWSFVFFQDVAELDYVDNFTTPEGDNYESEYEVTELNGCLTDALEDVLERASIAV